MDAMNLVMLVCAVLAALAFGVLLGYAACQALFSVLRIHAQSVSAQSARLEISETPAAQVQTAS